MGLVRHAIETFITRGLVAAIGVIITVLVARVLGPDGRGIFSAAMAVAAIGVQIGNVGLSSSNIYYAATDRSLVRTLIGNSLVIGVGGSSLFCFLGWALFAAWPELAPLKGAIFVAALVWVPIGIGLLLIQNLLLGLHHVRGFNAVELLRQGGTLLAIAVTWFYGSGSPLAFFVASLLILLVTFVATTGYLVRADGNRPTISFVLARQHARYGLKAFLATFFAFLVLRIDLLMIQYIRGEESTGLYSIAVAVADVLLMAPVALGTVLFPRLSAMEDETQRWRICVHAIGWVAVIMSVLSLLLMLGAGWVIDLLFGEPYLPALPAVLILLPAVVLLGVNTIFMNYFAAMGMPIFTVVSPGLAAMINVPANLYLIPELGITGAAWASLMSYGFMLLLSLGYAWTLHKNLLVEEA